MTDDQKRELGKQAYQKAMKYELDYGVTSSEIRMAPMHSPF